MEGVGRPFVIAILITAFVAFTTLNFSHNGTLLSKPRIVSDTTEPDKDRPVISLGVQENSMLMQIMNIFQSFNTSLKEIQTTLESQQRSFESSMTENQKNHCPSYRFVMTTADAGGLGNLMSEYASLLALSTLTGFTPVLGKAHQKALTKIFPSVPFEGTDIAQSCMNAAKALNPGILTETNAFLATKPRDRIHNIRLHVYPNAVFYYDKIRGVLKDHFTFKPEVDKEAEIFFTDAGFRMKSNIPEPIWVGIHVRRTTYRYHLNVTQNGTLVTFEYFERAIDRLKQSLMESNKGFNASSIVFVVASDDVEWCKTNFGAVANETILYSVDAFTTKLGYDRKYLDMCIMSKCNHSIIDYGTFGFWGAYLAGGHTILAHNIGTGRNPEVENIKPAKLPNWHFIDAHGNL